MNKENFYDLLGVSPEATQEEIRKAYHLLARKLHPDVAKEDGDFDQFKEITAAYDVLSDPEARAQYNKENNVVLRGPGNTMHEQPHSQERRAEEPSQQPPAEDRPVVELKGGLSSSKTAFKDLQRKLSKQDDLRVGQRVAMADPSLLEAEHGDGEEEIAPWAGGDATAKKRFDLKSFISSRFGKGAKDNNKLLKDFSDGIGGRNMDYLRDQQRRQLLQNNVLPADEELKRRKRERMQTEQKPEAAEGGADAPAGERIYQFQVTDYEAMLGTSREIAVPDSRDESTYSRIKVKIPAGTKDGTKMQASRGWMRMSFKVAVSPDSYYAVEGDNIFVKLPISLNEAVFGALVPVRTPQGNVTVKIKQGNTYSNPVVLTGRGMQPQGRDTGDLYAQPYVVFPAIEPEAVRDNLSRLKDSYSATAAAGARNARNASELAFSNVFIIPVTIAELLAETSFTGTAGGVRFSFKLALDWDGEPFDPEWQGQAPADKKVLPVLALPDVNETILADVAYRLNALSAQSPRNRMIIVE